MEKAVTNTFVRNVDQGVKDGLDAIAMAWGVSSQEIMRKAFGKFVASHLKAVKKGQDIMAQQRKAREE